MEAAIQGDLALLDEVLGERFAVLDRLTIGDFALAPALARTLRTGLDLTRYARIRGVRDELTGRDTWRQVGATA